MAAPAHIARENGKKGGRPKGTNAIQAEKAREYLIKRVTEELEPIVSKQIAMAKAGDGNMARYLTDQVAGKAKETHEVQGDIILRIDM